MPYEVTFPKSLTVADPELYWNSVCWGGDVVMERLLPAISARYRIDMANQEDWGWFIWFREGPVSLAIDIFRVNPEQGAFRLHLGS